MATWEVVVVGGGIIGCTLAHALAEAGRRVVLLDQGGIPGGASAASQSNLALHNRAPGPELALALKSLAMYRQLYEETGAFDFHTDGGIVVLSPNEDLTARRERARQQTAQGLPVEFVDAASLRDVDPYLSPDAAGALYCRQSGWISAPAVCRLLAERARARGATIMEQTQGTAIRLRRDRVAAVVTDRDELACESVVIAAGVESPEIAATAGVPLVIHALRGHILEMGPVPPLGVPIKGELGRPADEMYGEDPEDRAQARWKARLVWSRTPRGVLLLGRSEELGRRDTDVTWDAVRAIRSRAARWVPMAAELEVRRVYTGIRPESSDGRPIVGGVPGLPGLWLATGFGDRGIGLAYAARLLAREIVTGERDGLLEAFSYARPGSTDPMFHPAAVEVQTEEAA